jgi:hypothetical protein
VTYFFGARQNWGAPDFLEHTTWGVPYATMLDIDGCKVRVSNNGRWEIIIPRQRIMFNICFLDFELYLEYSARL